MEALNHLNNVTNNKAAFVPVELVEPIITAALTLGIVLSGGALSCDNKEQVLYIA